MGYLVFYQFLINQVIFRTGESNDLTSLRGFSTPICLSTTLWFPVVVAEAAKPAGFVTLGCKEGPQKKTKPLSPYPAWRHERGALCNPLVDSGKEAWRKSGAPPKGSSW